MKRNTMTLFTLPHFAYIPMLLFPLSGQEEIANLKTNLLGEMEEWFNIC